MTVFTVAIDIRSTDIDSDGIVNNAVYFMFQEEGRVRMLLETGLLSPDREAAAGEAPARFFTVAETSCRYLQPVYWPARLVVETRLTELRSRSFRLEYRMLDAGSGEPRAEGHSAQVWLDGEGRASPIPDEARQKLEAALEESVAGRPRG